METLLFGEVRVDYGQMYVLSDPEGCTGSDLGAAFAGQKAGLCGGAVPGSLFLLTGLHTGEVGLTVERHDEPPPLGPRWEEVVEVSFRPLSPGALFVEWGGDSRELDLEEIDYRVRYSARGMAEARDPDSWESEEPVDHYLLQFWPCDRAAPARIVRQTTGHAAYWHTWASKLPPPPTPEEVAEAARLAELERERERVDAEARAWGGRLPSDRLRAVRGNVSGMVELDVHLLHALDAAGPDAQRAVARLAANRACTVAGLAELDWVAPTLETLDRGRELAPPFDEPDRVWELLSTDERVPLTLVNVPRSGTAISQPHLAVPAVFAAADPDPLQAAVDALFAAAATYGDDYGTLLAEVRSLLERPR
ncbi:hypothetical protein OG292_28690 [Streptomyces sp. NBC_01511]|uniref:hypothetical protein n=1 Tax=unclassified Streptomyces TaxID=2593676 RepID=UPI0038657889